MRRNFNGCGMGVISDCLFFANKSLHEYLLVGVVLSSVPVFSCVTLLSTMYFPNIRRGDDPFGSKADDVSPRI